MNTSPTAKTPLCPGPRSICANGRRGFLQAGLAGFATLSLPGILRLQAQNTLRGRVRPAPREKNAVIMVWQPGGCSHLETYDPKPDAGSEYRGPFSTIPTKVPGMHFCELLPRQAAIADKFTVLRSMRQTAGGHPAGSMQLLSGDPDTRDKPKPRLPDWMSVTNYVRSQRVRARQSAARLRRHQSAAGIQRAGLPGRCLFAVRRLGQSRPADVHGAQHRSFRCERGPPLEPALHAAAKPGYARAGV